jgi:U6 snRNA-associated Sm-like protein LSm2
LVASEYITLGLVTTQLRVFLLRVRWYTRLTQLFYSFFKTLVGQPVTVELKNDLRISGNLVSVDQFLNIKLDDISSESMQLAAIKNCFIRGSVVRYVTLPATGVDTGLLQDAARMEAQQGH